jgi:hypothetical protein
MSAVRTISTSSWPTPTVSMITRLLPGGIEHERGITRRPRETTHVAARGHAANEDLIVLGVRLHAQAIAENRAARERAGRIDRNHADGFAGRGGSRR